MIRKVTTTWPAKHNIFGVDISAVDYYEAVEATMSAARERESAVVSLYSVHALVEASNDPELRELVNAFEMIPPDGQPVRWALNWFHKSGLKSNVRGTELTFRLCRAAAEQGVSIYLHGSTDDVLADLSENLEKEFPGLIIAGCESPPFRQLTDQEKQGVIERINASGAGLIFIGLGCPKQDFFAGEFHKKLHGVQLCVGAAFDFIAGRKVTAPQWMQRCGLEWLHRLCCEPKRLALRYFVTNSMFIMKFIAQSLASMTHRGGKKSSIQQQDSLLDQGGNVEQTPHFEIQSKRQKVP